MLAFAAVITFSALKIAENKKEHQLGADTYTALANTVVTVDPPEVVEYDVTITDAPEKTELAEKPVIDVTKPSVHVDFQALMTITPHSVVWICSNDGIINYPVVRGTDNEYYLNHMVDGTVNRNGSLFMDFRNAALHVGTFRTGDAGKVYTYYVREVDTGITQWVVLLSVGIAGFAATLLVMIKRRRYA